MNETPDIQKYVGENIRKTRLARGLSLERLAQIIYKSKSTVSKYEKGSIAMDISTLDDIALALDTTPASLMTVTLPGKQAPEVQGLLDKVNMYSYDGKGKRIIKSVIERYQTDEPNKYSIRLYYDIPSLEQLQDSFALYTGLSTQYDVLENFVLENYRHPIEQIWLSCISGLSQSRIQVGFLAGLMNTSLLPAVRKVAMSHHYLTDDELMERLVFTKKDLQTIRKLNICIINEDIL